MRRTAPRVLLWGLIFYAVSALVLNLVMDRWCPSMEESLYRTKWEGLTRLVSETRGRPLVVMLGSSRADGNFQAGRLNGLPGADGQPLAAYNFGVPKVGPIHEYLHLREMLDRGIRPRLLLIEFLPPLLNDSHTRTALEENWTQAEWISARQFARMAPYYVHPVRKGSRWLEARLAPWCVFRALLPASPWWPWNASAGPPDPYPRDHWGCRYPEPLTPPQRAQRWQITRQFIPLLERFKLGSKPVRALHDLLACCQREHIDAALVLAPESREFRSWYTPSCRAELAGLLAELQADYKVPVIDGSAWLDDDDDFMDGQHLTGAGAGKFTTRLLVEVRHLLP